MLGNLVLRLPALDVIIGGVGALVFCCYIGEGPCLAPPRAQGAGREGGGAARDGAAARMMRAALPDSSSFLLLPRAPR